jgi:hypothetical protein
MRYIIVDTWNGQGYSDSGIVEDTTYTDMTEDNARYLALESAREHFAKRYLPSTTDHEVKITYQQDALCVSDGDDDGAIHFVKVEANHYGLLIRPDVNEIVLLTQDGFIEHYEDILESIEGDRDELLQFIDEMFDEGNGGAHTGLGYEILCKLKKQTL